MIDRVVVQYIIWLLRSSTLYSGCDVISLITIDKHFLSWTIVVPIYQEVSFHTDKLIAVFILPTLCAYLISYNDVLLCKSTVINV